jgi:dynein heavy chain, axonemal
LAIEYEKYKANGPGTADVSLDEGLELLQASKDLCASFQIQKNDNLLSETLFDLEISTYPDLNDMVEKNKTYDMIYEIYREHRETVKDFSVIAWSKLDTNNLTATAEKFLTMVKRLEKKLTNPESYAPFVKLRATVEGFKVSIPFIQELSHKAI